MEVGRVRGGRSASVEVGRGEGVGGVLLWRWGGVRGGRSASVEVGRGEGWEECFCGGGEG